MSGDPFRPGWKWLDLLCEAAAVLDRGVTYIAMMEREYSSQMDRPIRALILGGIAWNTMVYVDEFPEPRPQTVFANGSHTTVGSSGAGKALNLRHLGADVTLWGLLGDDEPGRLIREFIVDRDVELVADIDPLGTTRHINLMDSAGERISIFAQAGSHEFDVDVESLRPFAERADFASVTIVNYCRSLLPMLQEVGKPIAVDIHDYDGVNPYYREFIDAADYLFMSSVAMPDWRSFLERRVAAGATVAVATHGSAGASGITADDDWVDVPAVPVESFIDTNGAGDAFHAGFMMSWLAGAGLSPSMAAGANAAATAIQSPDLAPA